MMNLISDKLKYKIEDQIMGALFRKEYQDAGQYIENIFEELYANIPDNKRISYGRVYTIKTLVKYLYDQLEKSDAPGFEIGYRLFENTHEFTSKGTALGIISLYGLREYDKTLPYFVLAAQDENWDIREMAQMFFRRLIKKFPEESQKFLLLQVKSENANIRRFVSETLRPVCENKWFYGKPEYSLTVLRKMFKEKAAYPRTSVGNNLSDLARRLPKLVYELAKELVDNGDKNSYWIAYRACRNLVKREPIRVMDTLKVDEYKYKKSIHRRDTPIQTATVVNSPQESTKSSEK